MECYCKNCKFIIQPYKHKKFVYTNNTPRNKAGVIIYNKETNHILIVQSRGNLWGFPKGSFEEGEEFNTCAVRELKEETGIDVDMNELNTFYNVNGRVRYYLVETNEEHKDIKLQEDKYCEHNDVNGICWIDVNCLKHMYINKDIFLNYHARSCLYYFFKISKQKF